MPILKRNGHFRNNPAPAVTARTHTRAGTGRDYPRTAASGREGEEVHAVWRARYTAGAPAEETAGAPAAQRQGIRRLRPDAGSNARTGARGRNPTVRRA